MTQLPKAGDRVECGIWLSGTETPEQLKSWTERDCPNAMRGMIADDGCELLLSPIVFETKRPGEDRVPQVPDHVSGPDVRLLVAEARIVDVKPLAKPSTFLDTLDKYDLQKLREITRFQLFKRYGALSDAECDRIIQQIGPDSAARVLTGANANVAH